MELTKKEEAWLERFRKTMAAAPFSLFDKVSAYTIGDNDITLYDEKMLSDYIKANPEDERDQGLLVESAGAELEVITFPFRVDSTAG